MFFGMTPLAQNLYIGWVSSSGKMTCMGFNMVSLKTLNISALFAFFAFVNNLSNCFSRRIASSASATIPQWVIFSSHVLTTYFGHTWNRTIFPGASTTLSYLKWLAASFAYAINKMALFTRFYKFSTFFRTGVCCATIMATKYLKVFFTSRANQLNFAPAINFSWRI